MYNEGLVVCVKKDGNVLREHGETVYMPFGSNYSLLIKNCKEEQKAKVNVEIDGDDALKGRSLIVRPDSSIELKRFINNSLKEGNRFKFIEATDKVREHRDNNEMNGIVKVTYRFEKKYDLDLELDGPYYWVDEEPEPYDIFWDDGTTTGDYTETMDVNNSCLRSVSTDSVSQDSLTEGITAPGEIVEQEFKYGSIGCLQNEKHMILLKLEGKNKKDEEVSKPLSTKDKLECTLCGTKSPSRHKFCPECGTSLIIK